MTIKDYVLLKYNKSESSRMEYGDTFKKLVRFYISHHIMSVMIAIWIEFGLIHPAYL